MSDSDQRRPLLLPQEVILIPEHDLIVLRSGIPPVVVRKVGYYKDKAMVATLFNGILNINQLVDAGGEW